MSFTDLGTPVAEYTGEGTVGDLADFAIAVDAHATERGWVDNAPEMFVLFCAGADEDADVTLTDGTRCTVERTSIGLHKHPRVEIDTLAHNARQAADGKPFERQIMRNMYPRAPYAHFLTTEAWGSSGSAGTELYDTDTGKTINPSDPRKIADLPGSIELRWTMGVHQWHQITVFRHRGHEARVLNADQSAAFWGPLAEALRTLHDAARALHNPLMGGS